jgi:hypothetical protein
VRKKRERSESKEQPASVTQPRAREQKSSCRAFWPTAHTDRPRKRPREKPALAGDMKDDFPVAQHTVYVILAPYRSLIYQGFAITVPRKIAAPPWRQRV